MRIPTIQGLIDRRILVNFRVDPEILARNLPTPFKPKLVHGQGVAGVCLIRLKHVRPRFVPGWLGLGSENAAHRIAVEWLRDGESQQGVYVPRRDTSSRLSRLAGGWLFPGLQHPARFEAHEEQESVRTEMKSDDGETHIAVEGRLTSEFPSNSVFDSLAHASDFFERGALGYSATAKPGEFEGLELCCPNWHVQPLEITRIRSSYFDDILRFPEGSATFDCALLMRGIDHEWHAGKTLCVPDGRAAAF